jgi:hypothetical protein
MCPMHCQRLKGLARLDENRAVARRRFIASDDKVDIERVELDATTVTKLAVGGSTIARRIRTSHFDDENEPCSSFGARRHYKSSVQFTLRSTTILTRNVISSPAKSTNRDARLRWSNGAQS